MRKELNVTEGIFPMPVLMVATYNEDGSVNVMNAAWGTMQERDTVVLNLTESHKTVQNIKARGAFTVSIADAGHVVEADYFGVESGNKTLKKFENSGLTAVKSEHVDIAVITVPAEKAQLVADTVADAGIKGIWNLTAVDLELPEGIAVENVHMSDSLHALVYYMQDTEE